MFCILALWLQAQVQFHRVPVIILTAVNTTHSTNTVSHLYLIGRKSEILFLFGVPIPLSGHRRVTGALEASFNLISVKTFVRNSRCDTQANQSSPWIQFITITRIMTIKTRKIWMATDPMLSIMRKLMLSILISIPIPPLSTTRGIRRF